MKDMMKGKVILNFKSGFYTKKIKDLLMVYVVQKIYNLVLML